MKTELYDHLDCDSISDGSSDSSGQLKNTMRADIYSMLGPDQALVDLTTRTPRTNFNRHPLSDLESITLILLLLLLLFVIL